MPLAQWGVYAAAAAAALLLAYQVSLLVQRVFFAVSLGMHIVGENASRHAPAGRQPTAAAPLGTFQQAR